jgi:hypothetical protein
MVESIHPNRADEIVSALLVADRNEIIGLLESPSSLEAAVVQVLPNLPLPKRGSSPLISRLQLSRFSGDDPGPASKSLTGAGADIRGVRNNDQQKL